MVRPPSCLVAALALSFPVISPLAAAGDPSSPRHCADEPFVQNLYWTTDSGPAAANVLEATTNMVPCTGPYALCYYSGPAPLDCTLEPGLETATCKCAALRTDIETQVYYVDINAISNTCVYVETVRDCGHDGSGCQEPNSAPVCDYIAQGTFSPGADLISTYSTALAADYGGVTACTECESALYAGCMTAPCTLETDADGDSVAVCKCPTFTGPFQVGQDDVSCDIAAGQVWSAAYNTAGCPAKPAGN